MAGNVKKKAEDKLQKIFDNMACENPEKAIHGTATAAAGIIALLPIGVDAWALRLSEVLMLISIYSHYGVKLSKSAAESMMSAAFMQAVGEVAAITALEAADAAAISTGGLGALPAYGIKVGIAVSLIETVGWTTVKYLEGNKIAEKAIHIADSIGVAADIARITGVFMKDEEKATPVLSEPAAKSGGVVSFTGCYAGRTEAGWKMEAAEWLKKAMIAKSEEKHSTYGVCMQHYEDCLARAAKAALM